MQFTEQRPFGHTELARSLGIETAEPLMLDQRITERTDAVLCLVGNNVVVTAVQHRSRRVLMNSDLERHALDAEMHGLVQNLTRAFRPMQVHGIFAPLQAHRSEQTDDAEGMIGVRVCEDDVVDREAGGVAHHLPLRALAAVEHHQLTRPCNHERRNVAPDGWPTGSGTEEYDTDHDGMT